MAPLVPPHDPQHRRHTQSPPGKLGAEEWIKQPGERLSVHTATVVHYFQIDILAGSQVLVKPDIFQITGAALHATGIDGDHATPVTNRFGGVDDQIHDDLAHLSGVRLHQRQIFVLVETQFRLL